MSDAELPAGVIRLSRVTDAELVDDIRGEMIAVVSEFDAWRASSGRFPVGPAESLVAAVDKARLSLGTRPVGREVDEWVKAAGPLLNPAWPLDKAAEPVSAAVERLRRAAMWRPMSVRSARQAVHGSEADPPTPGS